MPVSEFPERLRWHAMVIWCGEKTHLVHYPLRGGELFNLVAVFQSSQAIRKAGTAIGEPAELTSDSPSRTAMSGAFCRRSRPGACGCSTIASRSSSGALAA